ncbi:MAG TPA: glyoxylate/hydroxypyruvate reductase A [Thermohalobaculum sp.]|nr:glyoxylate/hydroxypyruvate reductase A [Thermohalobaculum sp.]
MPMLIDIAMPEWKTDEAFRAELAPLLPGADLRCMDEPGDLSAVTMLATVGLRPGLATLLPALRLVQKLGAGVETMVHSPELPPDVQVARLKSESAAREIAEYCVAYVLRFQRNMALHEAAQAKARWEPVAPRETPATTVGVLGLGTIGARVAAAFAGLGFRVLGWSRGPKDLPGILCRHGAGALRPMLGECDYVASILPSTPETRDLADARFFAAMKPGAVLINAGRGDLVVEADLLAALDGGHLGGAVLDVLRAEPLPSGHPLWRHPKVTITPHVSGWRVTGGAADVAENYRRLSAGRPPINLVDRGAGY